MQYLTIGYITVDTGIGKRVGISAVGTKKRKFELTPAGEFFYKKSLVLIADYEQIVRETTRLAGGGQECLKVGFLHCYSGPEFHLALEEFTGKYPDIPVEVFYGNHDELHHMLLKNETEKETEAEYYHTVIGLKGEKLFTDNMEEAGTLVISGKGFMPSEGRPIEGSLGKNIVRIPLYRGNEPMKRNYCAFWKKENTKQMSEEFAEILRCKFEL